MNFCRCFQFIIVAFIIAATALAAPSSIRVTEAEFGDKWPFTVSDGVIIYESLKLQSRTLAILTFKVGEKVYALNGIASGRAKTAGYLPIEEIWKQNPRNPRLKIDIGPIIERGLELAEKQNSTR